MTRIWDRIPRLVLGVSLVILGAGFLVKEGYYDRIFRAFIGFGEWHEVVGLIFIGLGTLLLLVGGRRAR